jgi:hypothetical protein
MKLVFAPATNEHQSKRIAKNAPESIIQVKVLVFTLFNSSRIYQTTPRRRGWANPRTVVCTVSSLATSCSSFAGLLIARPSVQNIALHSVCSVFTPPTTASLTFSTSSEPCSLFEVAWVSDDLPRTMQLKKTVFRPEVCGFY